MVGPTAGSQIWNVQRSCQDPSSGEQFGFWSESLRSCWVSGSGPAKIPLGFGGVPLLRRPKGLKAKDFRSVVVRDYISRAFDATNGSSGLVSSVWPINKCCSAFARASLPSLSRARSHSVQPGLGFWPGLGLLMHPLTVAMAAMAVTVTNSLRINGSKLSKKTFRLRNCFLGVIKTSQIANYSIIRLTISKQARYFASTLGIGPGFSWGHQAM